MVGKRLLEREGRAAGSGASPPGTGWADWAPQGARVGLLVERGVCCGLHTQL